MIEIELLGCRYPLGSGSDFRQALLPPFVSTYFLRPATMVQDRTLAHRSLRSGFRNRFHGPIYLSMFTDRVLLETIYYLLRRCTARWKMLAQHTAICGRASDSEHSIGSHYLGSPIACYPRFNHSDTTQICCFWRLFPWWLHCWLWYREDCDDLPS